MDNYIPSEYYRNFCKEKNITFSEREWATIIWHNPVLTLNEKLAGLEELVGRSTDNAFKQAIDAKITYKRDILGLIYSSENGRVFITEIDDTPFDEFDAARDHCKKASIKDKYKIERYCVLSSCDDPSNFKSYYSGGVRFNTNGEIIDAWDNEVEYPGEFTDCFIPFANPFERGDIVRDCISGKIGVVETSQNEWNDYLKRNENNKAYDYSDATLIVQFLDNESFSHSHIQPIYLEKLPLNERNIPICFDIKNNFNEELLCCSSELMRGDIALDAFLSNFLEWREERIYKQIKSRSRRS